MGDDGLRIRPALREEMGFFLDRAAEEGWNPGLGDGEPFFSADPEGFLLGFLGEEPVGCVSAVAYGGTFGFLGFYIVRPPFRGRGYGLRLWVRGLEHLAGRVVGLDGVVAQQENYRRSGFRYAHRNVRFRGKGTGTGESAPFVTSLAEVPLEDLCRFDRSFFPERRREFLRLWRGPRGGAGAAWIREGVLEGYGVLRPCRVGYKAGPLFARTPEVAEDLLAHLEGSVPAGAPLFLDVPGTNPAALDLTRRRGMEEVFETARMYTGEPPGVEDSGIFGVTSFELG